MTMRMMLTSLAICWIFSVLNTTIDADTLLLGIIILIFKIRKLNFREAKQFA